MKFASPKEFVKGGVAFAIAFALFYLFDYLAKRYDKKHPNAPRVSGHHMSTKAGYSFSRGELIFHQLYFWVVVPALLILVCVFWKRI